MSNSLYNYKKLFLLFLKKISGKLPPMKAPPCENYPPRKLPRGKITPNEISSPLINHTNEKEKNYKIKFFLSCRKLCNTTSCNIKITKFLFDTQMISQKILRLDTFFTE